MSQYSGAAASSAPATNEGLASYIELKKLDVMILTYNCNAKIMSSHDIMKQILHERGIGKCEKDLDVNQALPIDILVVGLQEMVELNADNVVLSGNKAHERVSMWINTILAALNAGTSPSALNIPKNSSLDDVRDSSSIDYPTNDVGRESTLLLPTSALDEDKYSMDEGAEYLEKYEMFAGGDNFAGGADTSEHGREGSSSRQYLSNFFGHSSPPIDKSGSSSTSPATNSSTNASTGGSGPSRRRSISNTFFSTIEHAVDTIVSPLTSSVSPTSISNQVLNASPRDESEQFIAVANENMVGTTILIFAKVPVAPLITNIKVGNLARGIGGVLGNKGGVAVRCDIYDSSVCFVCCHFAAGGHSQVSKRNDDYKAMVVEKLFQSAKQQSIDKYVEFMKQDKNAVGPDKDLVDQLKQELEGLRSRIGTYGANVTVDNMSYDIDTIQQDEGINYKVQSCAGADKRISPDDHDVVFWFGDLNYRLDGINIDDCYSYIQRYEEHGSSVVGLSILDQLLSHDELLQERRHRNIFDCFDEDRITFPPTYQYIPGTPEYDRRPDHKMRPPAWCDRILYRTRNNCHEQALLYKQAHESIDDCEVKLREYISKYMFPQAESVVSVAYVACPAGIMSDHRPVKGIYELYVKHIDYVELEETLLDCGSTMFKHASWGIPPTFRPGNDYITSNMAIRPVQIYPEHINLYSIPAYKSKSRVKLHLESSLSNIPDIKYNIEVQPGGANTFPSWVRIDKLEGVLLGENTLEIVISTDVQEACEVYSLKDRVRNESMASARKTAEEVIIPELSFFVSFRCSLDSACSGLATLPFVDIMLPVRLSLGPIPDHELDDRDLE